MKNRTKYALWICVAVLTFVCLAITYGMGAKRSRESVCTGLNVIIADSTVNRFVSVKDISSLVIREYGKVNGMHTDSIDLNRIEKIAGSGNAVRTSEAYTTPDGKLNIRITQRRPVVRFQNSRGGFYADEDGFLFPLQKSFSAEVPIVEGALPVNISDAAKGKMTNPRQEEWIMQIIGMVRSFDNDRRWKNCITQIHVNDHQELEVATRRGKEVFIFGQPTDIADKMDKMETYFRTILPSRNKPYAEVDLRFKGKILGKD